MAVQDGQDEEDQQMIFRMDVLIQGLIFYRFDIQDLLKRKSCRNEHLEGESMGP
jgi:hypothetical protein